LAWLDVVYAAGSLFRDGVSDWDIVEIHEAVDAKDIHPRFDGIRFAGI
jgi:hypothetical protein